MTERLHFSLSCIGEGNGNPLQCSCLENPKDGGAWWAAVYGVTQSQTRLKWLSSIGQEVGQALYVVLTPWGHLLASWLELSVLRNADYPGRVHIPKPLGTALWPAEPVLPLSVLKSTAAASTDLWFLCSVEDMLSHILTCTGLPERLLRLPVYIFPSFLISHPVHPSISSCPESWSLPPQPSSTRVLCCDTSFLQWA